MQYKSAEEPGGVILGSRVCFTASATSDSVREQMYCKGADYAQGHMRRLAFGGMFWSDPASCEPGRAKSQAHPAKEACSCHPTPAFHGSIQDYAGEPPGRRNYHHTRVNQSNRAGFPESGDDLHNDDSTVGLRSIDFARLSP